MMGSGEKRNTQIHIHMTSHNVYFTTLYIYIYLTSNLLYRGVFCLKLHSAFKLWHCTAIVICTYTIAFVLRLYWLHVRPYITFTLFHDLSTAIFDFLCFCFYIYIPPLLCPFVYLFDFLLLYIFI